jgi:hypothetical protein
LKNKSVKRRNFKCLLHLRVISQTQKSWQLYCFKIVNQWSKTTFWNINVSQGYSSRSKFDLYFSQIFSRFKFWFGSINQIFGPLLQNEFEVGRNGEVLTQHEKLIFCTWWPHQTLRRFIDIALYRLSTPSSIQLAQGELWNFMCWEQKIKIFLFYSLQMQNTEAPFWVHLSEDN